MRQGQLSKRLVVEEIPVLVFESVGGSDLAQMVVEECERKSGGVSLHSIRRLSIYTLQMQESMLMVGRK